MAKLDYRLFDADNHYYEPRDCFTRHIEPTLRDRAIRVGAEPTARSPSSSATGRSRSSSDPFPTPSRPGLAARACCAAMSRARAGSTSTGRRADAARVHDRDARLALMDQQGVESILLFPTLGVCVEHFMKDDPEQLYANFHAFNHWLDEDWGFDHDGRIFAAPLLSLRDVDRAVAELDWVLARGARVVALRPGPGVRSLARRPALRPVLGARRTRRGVPVAFHIGESGYNEMMAPYWGEEAEPVVAPAVGVPVDAASTATARSWTRSPRSCSTTSSAASRTCAASASRTARCGCRTC